MYRHLRSQCLENAVLGRLDIVRCKLVSDTNQKHVWNISKLSGFLAFGCVYNVFYNVERVKVCKISELFWEEGYCKMSDLFCQFLLALSFSARKSEIKG